MRYRDLGNAGRPVSEIGFGAWGIGGVAYDARAYGPTDDQISLRSLERALDVGITFFDTAPLYGYGHSEELIGMALGPARDRVVISSKVGYVNFSGEQDFSPAHMRKSLEGTLKRLKTDYLDIYQLHDPPLDLLRGDDRIFATLERLRDEGKIRVAGISVKSVEEAVSAVTEFSFKSIQVNFSLVDQRALEYGLFDECGRRGIGVIVRTPLCFGFLTGKYGADDTYDQQDHRSRWSREQIERWAAAYKLFTHDLVDERGQTNAQIALRFCLSYEGVSTVIPGMLTAEHVDENAGSSDLGPLPPAVLKEFNRIYKENRFMVRMGR